MAIDVSDREVLEGWLEKQPREVVVGFAARSVLRVFPLLSLVELSDKNVNGIIIPVLRAMALPWVAATYPTHSRELANVEGATDLAHAVNAADTGIAAAACHTANAAAHLVIATVASENPENVAFTTAAAHAVIAANLAADNGILAAAAAHAAVNFDINEIVKINAPLWMSKKGNEVPAEVIGHWNKLKAQLLRLDPNWQVWTGWYEARLWPDKFAPPNQQLELARALIPLKFWRFGWEAVNSRIEELMVKYEPDEKIDLADIGEVEPQNTLAQVFIIGEDGLIDVDTRAGSKDLLDDDEARDRHDEAQRLAQDFVNGFDRDEPGANQATGLLEDIRHYIEPLGNSIEEIRPGLLITRGDGLRQTLDLQKSRDDFSALPEISDKHLLALGKLVAAHNYLVGLDPELAKRDEVLLGPDARKNLVVPEEGQQVIHVAVEIGLAAPAVEKNMQEEADIAPQQPDAENRVSRRYSEGVRNFARVALGKAKAVAQFAWKHKGKVGATGLYPAAQWVVAHEAWLLKTFADNPHMLELIKQLLEMLHKLPLS